MRVCIHHGSKKLGGSCVEVESEGKRIILDFGIPLDAENIKDQYMPLMQGLDGNDPSLLGILISHPHLNHYGLLSIISSKIPIGMGSIARKIIKDATPFINNKTIIPPLSTDGWNFKSGEAFNIGPFCIIPYLVDHEAYDTYALKIESGGKSIFYSGIFLARGRKSQQFDYLIKNPPNNIDTLLLECSSLSSPPNPEQFLTENHIENVFVKILYRTKGLALIHTSVQNIDRVASIFRASKRTGRKIVIDLYTAIILETILETMGSSTLSQANWADIALYVPKALRSHIKDEKLLDLLNHHSANRLCIDNFNDLPYKATLLFRPLHSQDLDKAQAFNNAVYICSQWIGYWEQGSCAMLMKWLEKNNIIKDNVHSSGHASISDVQKLIGAMNPKTVVPIHSFNPEKYNDLFPNTKIYNDTEWWDV